MVVAAEDVVFVVDNGVSVALKSVGSINGGIDFGGNVAFISNKVSRGNETVVNNMNCIYLVGSFHCLRAIYLVSHVFFASSATDSLVASRSMHGTSKTLQ